MCVTWLQTQQKQGLGVMLTSVRREDGVALPPTHTNHYYLI